jgi:Sensors of blue-light using FAD
MKLWKNIAFTFPYVAMSLTPHQSSHPQKIRTANMTAEPPIFQLIYFSERLPESTLSVVELICENAFERNRAENITGLLVYNHTRFLQFIKGPKEAVSRCYARIAVDTRHYSPLVIWEHYADERTFPGGAAMRIEAGSNERFASMLALSDLTVRRDDGLDKLRLEGQSRFATFKTLVRNRHVP